MATKRFSEFRKGTDRIKIYAKGLNSNRNVELTGNITGSTQTDLDEGATISIATTITDNAVTNSKIADSAVSTSKLQDDAVTGAKIFTGAVTGTKIAAAAVGTDKIADGAVTLEKISSSAIDNTPTESSGNLVTSDGVKRAIDNSITAAVEYLDFTDTVESHKFVTSVSETDGIVRNTKAQPVIADVSGLQSALDDKAPLASPALTGTPTVPTADSGTNNTQIASTAFVRNELASVTSSHSIAYFSTSGNTIFKMFSFVVDNSTSTTSASFSCLLTRSNSTLMKSDVEIQVSYKTSDSSLNVEKFVNTISYSSSTQIEFKLHAYCDAATRTVTIYAQRMSGSYVNLEMVCNFVNNESSLQLSRVTAYVNTSESSLPGTTTEETTLRFLNTDTSGSSVGGAGVPVYVNQNGTVKPCTVDGNPTPSSTNLVTSGGVNAALDEKENADQAVAFADAIYTRTENNQNGDWFKIASIHATGSWRDAFGSFDLFYANTYLSIYKVNVSIGVRFNASGEKPSLSSFVVQRTGGDNYGVRVVTRGVVGNYDVELWVYLPKRFISLALKMLSGSDVNYSEWRLSKTKGWTFYSSKNGGTSLPADDTSNNVYVYEPTENILLKHAQTAVTDPTASGTSLSFIDSITQNTNGEITPTKKTIPDATNAQKGVVYLKKLSDVSGMGDDDNNPYSGAAISQAISTAISGTTGGFLGEKTVAEMNAYSNPKMGDNAIITNTGTVTVGNTPCVISAVPSEIRWTTSGSWVVTSSGYVRDTDVASTSKLGLVKLNTSNGGVELNNENQMVVHGWDTKAAASDVTNLQSRMTTAEGDIDNLESSVIGKLAKSDAVWTIDDSDDAIIVDDEFMSWVFQP